jgi:hypothetical protein
MHFKPVSKITAAEVFGHERHQIRHQTPPAFHPRRHTAAAVGGSGYAINNSRIKTGQSAPIGALAHVLAHSQQRRRRRKN